MANSIIKDINKAIVSGVTMQSAAAATANGTALDTQGYAVAQLQVTGTFVGTITFEATVDGTNWVSVNALNLATGLMATTTTSTGIFRIVVAGLHSIRARVSAFTSGTITVVGRATTVSAPSDIVNAILFQSLLNTIDSITAYPPGVNCTVVDLATDADVTVSASPAKLLGIHVLVVMSAHAAPIKDGTTTIFSMPASTAAGYDLNCRGTSFATSIVVESDNSATGTLLVFWI